MLKEILQKAINVRKSQYAKHREKIEAKAEELNKGAVISGYNRGLVINTCPTWGKDGRPHSPFDGYLWEDIRTGNIDSYGGGQYLPYTDDFDDINKSEYSGDHGYYHILMTPEMIQTLSEKEYEYLLRYYSGKSWDISGVTVTSVKTYAPKYILDILKEYSQHIISKLREKAKENKGTAPEGRTTISGQVVSTKDVQGYYGETTKCLIILENKSTVWGTLPGKLDKNFRGKITITATFKQNGSDNTHAFYSRPSLIEYED